MNQQSQEITRKIDKLLIDWEALLQSDPELAESLPGRIKFVVSDQEERSFVVCGSPEPGLNTDLHAAFDCCLRMPALTLLAIVAGEINPQVAFVQGKIKVSGDASLALRLNKLFERAQPCA